MRWASPKEVREHRLACGCCGTRLLGSISGHVKPRELGIRLIASCTDSEQIRFADLGPVIAGTGSTRIPNISPDLVHFNA